MPTEENLVADSYVCRCTDCEAKYGDRAPTLRWRFVKRTVYRHLQMFGCAFPKGFEFYHESVLADCDVHGFPDMPPPSPPSQQPIDEGPSSQEQGNSSNSVGSSDSLLGEMDDLDSIKLPGDDGARVLHRSKSLPQIDPSHVRSLKKLLSGLLECKSRYNLSQSCTASILNLFKDFEWIPDEIRKAIPSTELLMLATLEAMGIHPPKVYAYDCCKRCGLLFRNEHSDPSIRTCPDCNAPRYKVGTDKAPLCTFYYFSIIEFVKHLFATPSTAKAMRHHSLHNSKPNEVLDIYDSVSWRKLVTNDRRMAEDCRNVALALGVDGIMPFKKSYNSGKGVQHTLYLSCCTILNYPPWLRYTTECTFLSAIIPGPSPKQLQSFLSPLVDELKVAYYKGVDVVDSAWNIRDEEAGMQKEAIIRLKLIRCIADLRALAKLEVCPQTPCFKDACVNCNTVGFKGWPKGKTLYPGDFRFLPQGDPLRARVYHLNNPTDAAFTADDVHPDPKTNERRKEISNLGVEVQLIPNLPAASGIKNTVLVKSVLTELPYYNPNLMTDYDPMHTIGGVVKDFFDALTSNSRFKQPALDYERSQNRYDVVCSSYIIQIRLYYS